jgi:integrase
MPRIQRNEATKVAHFWDTGRGQWRQVPVRPHSLGNTRPEAEPPLPLTVRQLTTLYRKAGNYRELRESSRQSYDHNLSRICDKFGDLPISAFEERGARAAIRQWRDDILAFRPRSADMTVGMLRRLLNFAIDEEYIDRNPAMLLGRLHTTSRRDAIWTDQHIASFLKSAPRYLSRALLLAIWTGQRQGDLLALTWDSYDGAYIRLEQGKATGRNGRRVKVRVAKELRQVLAEIKQEQIDRSLNLRVPEPSVILTNQKGRPWGKGFRCAWRRAVATAGIEGLTFHDLRGTFITLAHRAGSTIKEIAEASGHDESVCERVIRRHYLATGAELLISKLETVSEFAGFGWDEAGRPTDDLVGKISPASERLLRGKEQPLALRKRSASGLHR